MDKTAILDRPRPRNRALLGLLLLLASVSFVALGTSQAWAGNEASFGTTLQSASTWLQGAGVVSKGGVDVYANGDTSYVSNNYSAPAVGMQWQCVELTQRLYQAKGWHSGYWSGVTYAYQIYDNASANGLVAHPNDGSYTPVPGDMIVHSPDQYDSAGHVAIVDHISGNTLYAYEQNVASSADNNGIATYTISSNGVLSRSSITQPIRGIVHSPSNPNTNTPPSNGVQHVYSGASDGSLHETYWGGGNSLTTWQLANVGSAVTSVSSFFTSNNNGTVTHVFDGTQAGTLHETYWGGGNSLTSYQLANVGSPVTSIVAAFTPSNGVAHVFSGTSAGTIFETYWGGGNSLTTYQLANVGSPVMSLSFQLTPDGVAHVYSGTSAGTIFETYWGGGNSRTTWQIANIGSPVTSIASVVTGSGTVQHVYSGASDGSLHETYWGGGNSLTTWQLANIGSPVASISYQLTPDTVQHVYSGAQDGSLHETYWGGGNSLTTWQLANIGSPVTTISSQVTGSGTVQHVYSGASDGSLHETYWGGGNSLTTWQLASLSSAPTSISTQIT